MPAIAEAPRETTTREPVFAIVGNPNCGKSTIHSTASNLLHPLGLSADGKVLLIGLSNGKLGTWTVGKDKSDFAIPVPD